jgi:hypothetical protein
MIVHGTAYTAASERARVWLLATLAAFTAACSQPSHTLWPTLNQGAVPSTPSSVTSRSAWTVTVQAIADEGPDFCIHLPAVGSTGEVVYLLVESGDVIEFVPSDSLDSASYTATRNGRAFAATNKPVGSGGGMCTHYLHASELSGTFSADDKSFTATETESFTLDSGQVKTITYSWLGVAQ